MEPTPPSLATVIDVARAQRRMFPAPGRGDGATTLRLRRAMANYTDVSPPALRPRGAPVRRGSHLTRPEHERRSSPWWRRWWGPFGFEIRNYTRFYARVILRPQPHAGPVGDFEVDLGVSGIGNLGLTGHREVLGAAHGNDIFLEPRGADETTGQPRRNRHLVRVETKEVYATVLLLDPDEYRWHTVLPCKKVSAHYNFNILDHYGRMLRMFRGPPTSSAGSTRRATTLRRRATLRSPVGAPPPAR